MNNGWTSNFFQLSRGVRQGCPLSPYLFILSVEVLAEAIRKKKEIGGIEINGTDFKLSQFADDTTLILDGAKESFLESLLLIDAFGNISGLKLNYKKTEALWIGSMTDCKHKLCPEKNFKWPKKKVKALGVWFSTDPNITISLNYSDKIEKITSILECWKFHRLSLLGKILVLKSLVASQLVYILTSLQTNHEAIQKINTLFYAFLWNGEGDKVKRKIMINDYPDGGLKMLDIASFNKSLKTVWVKKYLDPESSSKRGCFFDLQLRKYGGSVVPKGNLNLKDTKDLRISDPFVKEILEIWSEVCFEEEVTSVDHFSSLPLWQNSLLQIQNKPVLYNDWISKGILQVKHLMDDSCNLLSLTAFQNKYDIKVQPLTFFGITSAVNRLCRSVTRTHNKYESFLSKLLNTKKPSRLAYQKLVSKKSEHPISCQEKMEEGYSFRRY